MIALTLLPVQALSFPATELLVFLCAVSLVAIYWDACKPPAKRLLIAALLAVALSGGTLYAAVVHVPTCADFEPYSFLWYYWGCFL